MGFLAEYREWRKEHRQEIQQARMRRQLLKQPLDYLLLEEWMTAFANMGNRDLRLRVQGSNFTVELYYDDNGSVRRMNSTELILNES